MNLRALFPFLALLAVLSFAAGCTEDPAAGRPAPTDGPAALIAPEALASFVPPAPPGWSLLAPPTPALLEEDGVPLASVAASYLSDGGNRSADLSIQDTGGRSVGLRRLVDRLPADSGGNSSLARTTLRGQPAVVLGDGSVSAAYIVVADRYVVCLAVTDGTPADVDAFVAALDLERLSGRR